MCDCVRLYIYIYISPQTVRKSARYERCETFFSIIHNTFKRRFSFQVSGLAALLLRAHVARARVAVDPPDARTAVAVYPLWVLWFVLNKLLSQKSSVIQ